MGSLLSGLLERDPSRRLGASNPIFKLILEGAKEVMEHPWFKNLNWEGLMRKQVKAPIVPFIRNEQDVSNFDRVFSLNSNLPKCPSTLLIQIPSKNSLLNMISMRTLLI